MKIKNNPNNSVVKYTCLLLLCTHTLQRQIPGLRLHYHCGRVDDKTTQTRPQYRQQRRNVIIYNPVGDDD